MDSTIKAIVGKLWKNEEFKLPVGTHLIQREFVVRIKGEVEKLDDQMISPTISIPLIPTLAFFWERCGLQRDEALSILRDAISDALEADVNENRNIKSKIDDVQVAMDAIRQELIEKLPKIPRSGKVNTKDLRITTTILQDAELVLADV